MSRPNEEMAAVVRRHVRAHEARDAAARSGDLKRFAASHVEVAAAAQAYRVHLERRGFPAPYGVGE